MSHHQQHNLPPFLFPSAPFLAKFPSRRPKANPSSNRRLFCAPYRIRNAFPHIVTEQQQRVGHEAIDGPSRKSTFEGYGFEFEGSLEVALEVEVKGTEDEEVTTEGAADSNPQGQAERKRFDELSDFRKHFEPLPHSSLAIDQAEICSLSRHSLRPKSAPSPLGSIRQLLRFDPAHCFDIDELRVQMTVAQQKIEDLCSLNLSIVKLKHENGKLRERLDKSEQRIALLESSLLERNERLKGLLKENVFMRAQFKKLQNEFGMEAVNEVFNGRG